MLRKALLCSALGVTFTFPEGTRIGLSGSDQISERNLTEVSSSLRNTSMKAEKKRTFAQTKASFLTTATKVLSKGSKM